MNTIDYQSQWDEYYPKVYGYFFRRVSIRQDVEDLTSISMTIFFDKSSSTTIDTPLAYLWKIAHFQLLNYIKNKTKAPAHVSLDSDFEVDQAIESAQSSYLLERKQSLMHCVQKHASPEDYEIINRTIVDDQKSHEIAEELGMKADLIRQRFHRAIKKLRKECSHIWNT